MLVIWKKITIFDYSYTIDQINKYKDFYCICFNSYDKPQRII